MPTVYCVCDQSSNCDCLGTKFEGRERCESEGECPEYQDGSAYGPGIKTVSYENTATCEPHQAAGEVEVTSYVDYINSNVHVGDLIEDDDISQIWGAMQHLANEIDAPLTYQRPTNMNAGDVVMAYHVLQAISNMQVLTAVKSDGKYYSGDAVGLIMLPTDYNIAKGELITASQFRAIAAWLTTISNYCICDSYNVSVCCQCDVVCDCNY